MAWETMLRWTESVSIPIAAVLLTYAIYSTVALTVSLSVVRMGWLKNPQPRLLSLRLAVILPILLTLLSPWNLTPWDQADASFIITLPAAQRTFDNTAAKLPAKNNLSITRDPSLLLASAEPSSSNLSQPSPIDSDPPHSDSRILFPSFATPETFSRLTNCFSLLWLIVTCYGLISLAIAIRRLNHGVKSSPNLLDPHLNQWLESLKQQMRWVGKVSLLSSERIDTPQACGILQPRILVPNSWFHLVTAPSQKAILAHEFAHILHRDPLWNFISLLTLKVFWFQPLNRYAFTQIKQDVELCADREATAWLDNPADLAWSLVDTAERLVKTQPAQASQTLFASMSPLDTTLEQRIAAILTPSNIPPESIVKKILFLSGMLLGYTILLCFSPKFQAPTSLLSDDFMEFSTMRSSIAKTSFVTGLFLTTLTPLPVEPQYLPAQETTQEVKSKIPGELRDFRGMLIGQMIERDVERGTFTVKVDYVSRVWENNRANNPRTAVGKTFVVDGVTGKWLDQLLLLRPGETVEFEAQHRSGDTLTFPGEWLRKVPPFDAALHPVPPDEFRGFAGVVLGKVVRTNTESHDLILEIESVEKSFERSQASNADSVKGKSIVVAGFWGKMSGELDKLKAGDRIRTGVLHRVPKSDHFTVAEFVEKVNGTQTPEKSPRVSTAPSTSNSDAANQKFPKGMEGFRGILQGELISRDVEKGELVFRAKRVTRTWKENRASDTESCRGQTFVVKRISGKWLDVLITLKPGDAIEVEAFHNGGDHLDFVAEWLKKVE